MKKTLIAIISLIMLSLAPPLKNNLDEDGPYVMYKGDKVYINYVTFSEDGATKLTVDSSFTVAQKDKIELNVATDMPGVYFKVKLKSKNQIEKCEHAKPKKMLILSDIEGEFGAFRKFLQANKVIDDKFNWIFGDAHLILVGDFVDRGQQQTEVLWLIYSLEEKAHAAGGDVHYVLGNHEIMNLSGDLRYLHAKYLNTAKLMNVEYTTLLGEQSELGIWFRSKNVAEKLGDVLLVHGGISPSVYHMDLDVPQVNKYTRPFFADSLYKYPNLQTDILMGDYGPFWYRGLYKGDQVQRKLELDSALSVFRVKHMITGHTIIADTVSMLFKGKLFNTDVMHAKGKSEGLLVEGKEFFRVDGQGNKHKLGN